MNERICPRNIVLVFLNKCLEFFTNKYSQRRVLLYVDTDKMTLGVKKIPQTKVVKCGIV